MPQIREKLIGLIHHKIDMTEAWEERFDRLTLSMLLSESIFYSYSTAVLVVSA